VRWVRRTSTSIALSTPIPPRVRPLLERSLRAREAVPDVPKGPGHDDTPGPSAVSTA
jgi:hypothetical protein